MKGGTHSKLMHFKIFAMRPMYQLFAHPSRLSLHWYMLTEAAIGFRFDCRGRSSKGLQAMSVVAERPRDETSVRDGVESMGT